MWLELGNSKGEKGLIQGGQPNVPMILGGGGGGGGKTKKEAKADKVPQSMGPNLITVPDTDFAVKETNPELGRAVDYRQHYDLVEEMSYLFVRVVRARNLMGKDNNGLSDPVSNPKMLLLVFLFLFFHFWC